ncbi:flagellar biosynthesis anti-sigma factor FlgM [Thermacetogenium phaeum DSM 12270]|uniref:Negative regulator of flagellin synthesis n=1 Tax=Thermacetogenium phaeum (strain ATCC BAA-254 / DSM 26808 / PB) TaxID=1089553 RepID=K4LDE6_THEPS|nr:flagellar biosynthesis anti-sigma factor FlgM [Thermacetogenium phaeum]AFV10803.1 flagellar biosynthesis anti-sigma factor FlgM [Thermacetogenium phaeum DSM 12270]
MNISGEQMEVALRLYGTQSAERPQGLKRQQQKEEAVEPQGEQGLDRAELSPQALDYRKIKEAVLAAPEIREDRVREIRDALAKGDYRVAPEDVAARMLERPAGDL